MSININDVKNIITNVFIENIKQFTYKSNQENLIMLGFTEGNVTISDIDQLNELIFDVKSFTKVSNIQNIKQSISDKINTKIDSSQFVGAQNLNNDVTNIELISNIVNRVTNREFIKRLITLSSSNKIITDYVGGNIKLSAIKQSNLTKSIIDTIDNDKIFIGIDDSTKVEANASIKERSYGKFNLSGQISELLKPLIIPTFIVLSVFLLLIILFLFYKYFYKNKAPKNTNQYLIGGGKSKNPFFSFNKYAFIFVFFFLIFMFLYLMQDDDTQENFIKTN